MKYHIVNAFTQEEFAGNPAAVVLLSDFPESNIMQSIAAEFDLSETAFVVPIAQDHYFIRWFTPFSEAPLCGHATIAAGKVLLDLAYVSKTHSHIKFSTINEEVELIIEKGEDFVLKFPKYQVQQVQQRQKEAVAKVVNIEPEEILYSHNCFLAVMRSDTDVRDVKVDLQALLRLECRALVVTARCTSISAKHNIVSRYFAPRVGIDEDPVCASAHCRLVPFWSERLGQEDIFSLQLSKRGGELFCKNGEDYVLIGGKARMVMFGEMICSLENSYQDDISIAKKVNSKKGSENVA